MIPRPPRVPGFVAVGRGGRPMYAVGHKESGVLTAVKSTRAEAQRVLMERGLRATHEVVPI